MNKTTLISAVALFAIAFTVHAYQMKTAPGVSGETQEKNVIALGEIDSKACDEPGVCAMISQAAVDAIKKRLEQADEIVEIAKKIQAENVRLKKRVVCT